VQVGGAGYTDGSFRMLFPQLLISDDFQIRTALSIRIEALDPPQQVLRSCEKVALVSVASWIGHNEVVDAVVGIPCPRDEMIDLAAIGR
jgi:hypothetical protein